MSEIHCSVCESILASGQQSWHLICPKCSHEQSTLVPSINSKDSHENINEEARESGLKSLRQENFEEIVEKLKCFKSTTHAHLLDVGSAHGWFLDVASKHFDVLGVEPDEHIFKLAKAKGHNIRLGYFPTALTEDDNFDIIVFNDVIEHIPDLHQILDACRDRLKTDGLLLLNLPSSKGIFYRAAKFLDRIGIPGPFERLWQKGMPSPHVHYFQNKNLNQLLARHDFVHLYNDALPSIKYKGLFSRITYGDTRGKFSSYIIYFMVALIIPVLRLLPKDIMYSIYRRN
jgi:SAM-dependent methyltransferase